MIAAESHDRSPAPRDQAESHDGAVKVAQPGDWAPGRWVHIAEPLADALEKYGPQLIDELRGRARERREHDRQLDRDQNRRRKHRARLHAVELYRMYRAAHIEGEPVRQTCERLAALEVHHPEGWLMGANDIRHLVQQEKRRVEGYLRERRDVRIARRYLAGWRDRDIARDCGCSRETVRRVLRERRDVVDAERRGELGRRLPSGGAA